MVKLKPANRLTSDLQLISTLTTVGFFSKPQVTDIANLPRWAFLLTFAGVGLRTNIREMMKQEFAHF